MIKSTIGKGIFKCGCGKKFSYYSSLFKHTKKKHKKGPLKGTKKVKPAGR